MQEEIENRTISELVDDVRADKMERRSFIKLLTAMGISATGVGIISAVVASKAFTHKPVQSLHPDHEAKQNLNLHDQHLDMQSKGNVHGLHSDYAPHAIVEDSMYEDAVVGHSNIMQRKAMGMAAIPDLKISVANRVAQGKQVTIEWVATGTHVGDLHGLPASGRQFSFSGVTVVVREDGKIVRESIYYDAAEVKRYLTSFT